MKERYADLSRTAKDKDLQILNKNPIRFILVKKLATTKNIYN